MMDPEGDVVKECDALLHSENDVDQRITTGKKCATPKKGKPVIIANIGRALNREDCGLVGDGKHVSADAESADPVSYAIGEFGRWQLQLTVLLSLFNLPCTWHIYALTFQGSPGGEYWCARPDNLRHNLSVERWKNISGITALLRNGKQEYNPCFTRDYNYSNLTESIESLGLGSEAVTAKKQCRSWEFEASQTADTIVSEWGLVCDREHLKNLAEMVFLLGVAFGGFCSGLVSDRFGRKKTLMSALVMQIILGILVAVTPWFEMYLVLRAILGFVCVSVVFTGFVLCVELIGGKWLTICGLCYMLPVPLSYIIISGIAYIVPGWRRLQLAITLPSILFLGLWWTLPESPRWLLTMGKVDEVMEVLKEAARVNKKPLPSNVDKILKQSVSMVNMSKVPKVRVRDLFFSPSIRKITLLLWIVWFSVYLVYYGLVLNMSNIGGDVYINSIVSGAVEIPSILISILILLKQGRRIPLFLTMIWAGVACLLTLVVPINGGANKEYWEWVSIALIMVGKFTISSSNVIIPMYTAELYPTVIRNLGVGTSNIPAGIALMIVPYLWNMSLITYHLPMTVIGLVAILGGFSVLLLPETADHGLTNTLHEEDTKSLRRKESRK